MLIRNPTIRFLIILAFCLLLLLGTAISGAHNTPLFNGIQHVSKSAETVPDGKSGWVIAGYINPASLFNKRNRSSYINKPCVGLHTVVSRSQSSFCATIK